MSIFKNKKFIDPEKLKDITLLKKIYNVANRILLAFGIFLNGLMMIMMLIRFSPVAFLFVVNTYFLVMAWKGRKLKLN
jgi:hypothetical protein